MTADNNKDNPAGNISISRNDNSILIRKILFSKMLIPYYFSISIGTVHFSKRFKESTARIFRAFESKSKHPQEIVWNLSLSNRRPFVYWRQYNFCRDKAWFWWFGFCEVFNANSCLFHCSKMQRTQYMDLGSRQR